MKKALKWIGHICLLLVVGVVAIGVGGYFYLQSGAGDYEGEVALSGLDGEVELLRDEHALVTIRAESERDSYYALGYVHAQDRFGQMELVRRVGQGRISELAGESTLRFDKLMRLLRVYERAEDSLSQLSEENRRSLDAYVAGVNAFLKSHDGPWPPEFYLFGLSEPEPWTAADSLVWGKLMALQLSGDWQQEIRRAGLAQVLDARQLRELFPELPEDALTTLAELPPGETLMASLPAEMQNLGASNAWNVTSARSATGAPLLANDPHLRLQAPPQWYLVRIETPDGVRAGATAPGVPVIVIGHNGTAAWGFTTTHSDTQDLVVEKIDPDNPENYLTPDGPEPFETRTEQIGLRGGESVEATFRYTRHGPVIGDVDAGAASIPSAAGGDRVVALAWPGMAEGDTTSNAFFQLNKATTWPAFRAAASGFVAPQQNIFYADVNGAIGFVAPAKVQIREGYDGSLPTSGWDKERLWSGFIPFAELPQGLNPENGAFVNANNRITPPDYAYELASDYEIPYRAERIEELLGDREDLTVEDMEAIQTDVRSPMAVELLPYLMEAEVSGEEETAALERLRNWDGTMAADAVEPLIFMAWFRALDRRLFADELGASYGTLGSPAPDRILAALRDHPHWCDDSETEAEESCPEILGVALVDALELLDRDGDPLEQTWGERHRATLSHPILGRIPVLGGFLSLDPATGGGNYTINRGTPSLSGDDLFRHIHGPGLRAVFDLSDLDNSRFVMSSGQSGNILSPHFGDLTPLWRDGRYVKLVAPAQDAARRLVLTPKE